MTDDDYAPPAWSVQRRRRWAIPGAALFLLAALVCWGIAVWTGDGRFGSLGGLLLIPCAVFTAILTDWS